MRLVFGDAVPRGGGDELLSNQLYNNFSLVNFRAARCRLSSTSLEELERICALCCFCSSVFDDSICRGDILTGFEGTVTLLVYINVTLQDP